MKSYLFILILIVSFLFTINFLEITTLAAQSGGEKTSATGSAITGVVKEEPKLPKQLFDISFDIEDVLILNVNDLVLKVSLESFGTEPTPVEMIFIIQDENKKKVYVGRDSIVVETESIFRKTFPDLDLDFGKYIVYLRTIYDEDVEDVFLREFEIRSKIGRSERQLFDISFELIRKTVEKIGDLDTMVTFENFGSEPTPVDMRFTFLDSDDREVYSEEDNLIVETEKVLIKEFNYLNLEKGDYTLVFTTLYNVDVEDEFRKKFTITGERDYKWLNSLSFALNFLFLFIILFLFRRSSFARKMKKGKKTTKISK